MWLERLNPNLAGTGADPFEASVQLGQQALQQGMQAKNKVNATKQTAMQNAMQAYQQQQQEEQEGLGSLLNAGLAFATGGASAGLKELAGEAIGGPLGDVISATMKDCFGPAAKTAGNALTDNLAGTALGNTMEQVGGYFGDYLNNRKQNFFPLI